MTNPTIKHNGTLIIITMLMAWIALIGQLYLILLYRKNSIPVTIIQFFSYFTILSNLLVATCTTYIWKDKEGRWKKFFSSPAVLSAIALYITITGVVYNAIMRFLWTPTGAQQIVDELLHSVVPLLFLGYWIFNVPKQTLQWKSFLPWLWFPFLYCMYILVRGAITNFYPYPFMDVVSLGYPKVILNCAWLVLAFLLLSLFFIAAAKLLSRYQLKTNLL